MFIFNGGNMKITAFNGTARHGQSNTALMVDSFLAGAQQAGAEVEHIRLAGLKISPCTACKSCWKKTPGHCVIRDDMAMLLEKFTTADLVIFATPIYVDNVSGLMKTFFDRLIPTGDPHWEFDESGECRHMKRHAKPTGLVTISNCGYPEQSHFDVLRLLFRRMARNMHLELCGEIYRGAGGLLSSEIPEFSSFIEDYLGKVHAAGVETATGGRISASLQSSLEAPLIPLPGFNEMFLKKVNQMVDSATEQP